MIISNKYEVVEEIGRGGMGIVCRVRHLELDAIFALKMLLPELSADNELVKRFHHEARIMAQLQHPNIVRVFDIDRDGDKYYFVMEHISGRNLAEILEAQGPLSMEEVLRVSAQVGQALAHAHEYKPPVIHRDIKPSNIMLEAGSGRVVLTDFGIAKLADQDRTRYTRTGIAIGTIRYCAPEQLQGIPDLDARADLYSLGLVMYEMCTGQRFFSSMTDEAIIGRLLYDPKENQPVFEDSIPLYFRRIVARAIAKDRKLRYPTARAMLAALAGVSSTDETRVVAASRPSRALPVSLAVVALGALAVLIWPRLAVPPSTPVYIPPEFTHWQPEQQTVKIAEGNYQDFEVAAKVESGQTVSYAWYLDDGGEVARGSQWRFRAGFDEGGTTRRLRAEAVDAKGQRSFREWTISITDVNRAPQLLEYTPSETSIKASQGRAQFRIEARDPDSEPLRYVWTLDGRPLPDTTPELDLDDLQSGEFEVAVRATDPAGGTATHRWSLEVPGVEPPPEPPPQALVLQTSPEMESISVGMCERQTFSAEANGIERYQWRVNGNRQPEEGSHFRFSEMRAGHYAVEVKSIGTEPAAERRWQVVVSAEPPAEHDVHQWVEAYRQALQAKDLGKLRELGYVSSDQQANRLKKRLQERHEYQVHVQDLQARVQDQKVRLKFERVDTWNDRKTYSMVVDYLSEELTLVRRNCTQVVASRSD